jgi:hypothetical protein
VKFAIVPPVTKPTALSGGSPSRSRSQELATSSTALCAGVRSRRPLFWSQALTSQSAASAAGWVPPMTKPKNRPDGIALSPGSQAATSRSTTSAALVGPSASSCPSAAATSATEAWPGTGRLSSEVSQSRAWRWACSRAVVVSSIPRASRLAGDRARTLRPGLGWTAQSRLPKYRTVGESL